MEVPRHWRIKKQRYMLAGEICPTCKTPLFPPRAVCPHCSGDTKPEYTLQHQPALALEEHAHTPSK